MVRRPRLHSKSSQHGRDHEVKATPSDRIVYAVLAALCCGWLLLCRSQFRPHWKQIAPFSDLVWFLSWGPLDHIGSPQIPRAYYKLSSFLAPLSGQSDSVDLSQFLSTGPAEWKPIYACTVPRKLTMTVWYHAWTTLHCSILGSGLNGQKP